MDLDQQFGVDEELEIKGAWIPGPRKDCEFLIARAANRKFTRLLSQEIEDSQDVLDGKDDAADKCSDEIMGRVMSKTILLGWRGKVGFGGKEEVPYSQAVAELKLTQMKEFRNWVNKQSEKIEHYRKKVEKALGNG